ncbi:glycosyltransferase [Roseibium sp.]|uniref:glycosyltransferase n=1 Tax=Roseibium sp. TaxID=1936156 RepID=UPI003A97A06B
MALPAEAFAHKNGQVLFVVGAIGIWRYSWGGLHLLRCKWFRLVHFPRMRRKMAGAAKAQGFGHAYLMVTSFRIDTPTTYRVYRAAFEAAAHAPGGATVVASIVELGDQRLIEHLYRTMFGETPPFKLIVVRIPGTGKRDALASGFEAIQACSPGANDTVSVIDGDSIVPVDLIEKCAGVFLIDPKAGALTTDENCTVEGRKIFKDWYSLRFAQRQVLMCSQGLAGRVLTLTGRMSMFRAQLVCDPDFFTHIREDYIDHWRLGRIKMLTGDDKSSWFWLLKNGYRMHYIPDVVIETIEQPPEESFLKSARVLMVRWFGNMLRTNSRALALGPRRIGLFTWWSVLDQRMSMWTCITGVVFAVLGTLFVSPFILPLYLLWVAVSRYMVACTLLSVRPSFPISYPFLLYFNQVFGSFVKIFIFFRLDRQKWTRQKTSLAKGDTKPWVEAVRNWSSTIMHVTAMSLFVAILAFVLGVFGAEDAFRTVSGERVKSLRTAHERKLLLQQQVQNTRVGNVIAAEIGQNLGRNASFERLN